jgi:hypothetical protein
MLLAECLVYISLFLVLTGIASAAYYRALEFSRDLRRNADDVVMALKAGERWRQDVRSASGEVRLDTSGSREVLVLSQSGKEVRYWFEFGTIWRLVGQEGEPVVVCRPVKRSQMIREQREDVACWRWELELKPAQKVVHLPPLFTFMAAAGGGGSAVAGQ